MEPRGEGGASLWTSYLRIKLVQRRTLGLIRSTLRLFSLQLRAKESDGRYSPPSPNYPHGPQLSHRESVDQSQGASPHSQPRQRLAAWIESDRCSRLFPPLSKALSLSEINLFWLIKTKFSQLSWWENFSIRKKCMPSKEKNFFLSQV